MLRDFPTGKKAHLNAHAQSAPRGRANWMEGHRRTLSEVSRYVNGILRFAKRQFSSLLHTGVCLVMRNALWLYGGMHGRTSDGRWRTSAFGSLNGRGSLDLAVVRFGLRVRVRVTWILVRDRVT